MALMIQNVWCYRLFITLLGLNTDSDKAVLIFFVCLGLFSCRFDLHKAGLLHTCSRAMNLVIVLALLGGTTGISSTFALSREQRGAKVAVRL